MDQKIVDEMKTNPDSQWYSQLSIKALHAHYRLVADLGRLMATPMPAEGFIEAVRALVARDHQPAWKVAQSWFGAQRYSGRTGMLLHKAVETGQCVHLWDDPGSANGCDED